MVTGYGIVAVELLKSDVALTEQPRLCCFRIDWKSKHGFLRQFRAGSSGFRGVAADAW